MLPIRMPKPTILSPGRKGRQAESADCSSEWEVWKALPQLHLLSNTAKRCPVTEVQAVMNDVCRKSEPELRRICKLNEWRHSESSCSPNLIRHEMGSAMGLVKFSTA